MCVFLQKYFLSKVKIFSLRQYNQWSFIPKYKDLTFLEPYDLRCGLVVPR